MLFKFLMQRSLLGIDITHAYIAAVELYKKQIISYGIRYRSTNNLLKELTSFICENHFQAKHVYTALPLEQSIRKNIPFSIELNEQDIEFELSTHQQKYFPGIQEKLVFDFVDQGDNKLIFAIKEAEIIRRIQTFKYVGFELFGIEPDSYALLRTVLHTESIALPKNQAAILLNTEPADTRVIIFNDTEILTEHIDQSFDLQEILSRFQTNFPDYALKNIYVIGSPLPRKLERLNIPILKVDPLRKMFGTTFDNLKHKNELLVALGLALRGLYD